MKRFVRIPVIVVVALLLMLVVALTVQAQGGASPRNPQRLPQPVSLGGGVTSVSFTEAEQADALRYWTAAAKSAAEPAPMGAALQAPDLSGLGTEAAVGAPGYAAAGMASPDAQEIARAAYALDWAVAGDEAAAIDPLGIDGTSQVYDFYNGNKPSAIWKIYPHVWEGLLTYRNGTGSFRCSATAISNSRIVTAAHCIFNSTTNVWSNTIAFSPAWRNGSAPYGTFAAQQCWVLTTWVNLSGNYGINSWAPHDVAVCRMGNNSAGQTLANAVGWAGRQWNWPYARHFFNLGYPAKNYANNSFTDAGNYLFICAAESFQQAGEVRGMGCYSGGGASGGAWLIGYKPFIVNGAVDGVNSGIFVGTQNIYGPRFNSNNIVPLCNAAGC